MSSHALDPNVPQPATFAFTEANMAEARKVIAKYPQGRQRSAVMPLLDLAQRQEGWLSQAAMDTIAELLSVPPIRVYEVATFYTMYRLRPTGKHHIELCTNISCWLRGSDDVKRAAEEVFGVPFGSSNDEVTLEEVECAGACVNAPVVAYKDDYYEDLTYENAKALFQAMKDGKPLKAGSQIGRQASCPEGGPTTLKETV
ncbi:NADH-quinone oxidoreductase subunit NuoE [Novispirillum sp. DQ9]|uniref:NADH-quinone oxidoreductase subunit NuoE n=1 Tax=Novispirillum sp. DQ9 TaxID=3398612 RepID=UPI003C7A5F1D